MTTVEKLTRYGNRLGLKGAAGKNGCLYFWANGAEVGTSLGASFADAKLELDKLDAERRDGNKRDKAFWDEVEAGAISDNKRAKKESGNEKERT